MDFSNLEKVEDLKNFINKDSKVEEICDNCSYWEFDQEENNTPISFGTCRHEWFKLLLRNSMYYRTKGYDTCRNFIYKYKKGNNI